MRFVLFLIRLSKEKPDTENGEPVMQLEPGAAPLNKSALTSAAHRRPLAPSRLWGDANSGFGGLVVPSRNLLRSRGKPYLGEVVPAASDDLAAFWSEGD